MNDGQSTPNISKISFAKTTDSCRYKTLQAMCYSRIFTIDTLKPALHTFLRKLTKILFNLLQQND